MLEWMDGLVGIMSGVCTFFGVARSTAVSNSFAFDISNEIQKEVNKKFVVEETAATTECGSAASAMNAITAEENRVIANALNSDPTYTEAEQTFKFAQEKVASIEKAIKEYKAPGTQVAVGSGDSAVAVSVSDNSARIKLETDLVDAKAMRRASQRTIDTLKKEAKAKVVASRDSRYFDTKTRLEKAKAEVARISSEKEAYKASLKADNIYMKKLEDQAMIAHYNKAEVISCAVLQSALPVYILYRIWKSAAGKLNDISLSQLAEIGG